MAGGYGYGSWISQANWVVHAKSGPALCKLARIQNLGDQPG
eukprot:CAMPEP_0171242558 /NCGR_PEP_ID=MMETSP0790-20130122/45767_1 /TAXON_ID=2925 /ORGANISM="Alexandrium catenella, Strain OF101" /LENGTH=40 /DNA_ID= /DNA_START= /DNA_END= /DNA_ORIENTATION=